MKEKVLLWYSELKNTDYAIVEPSVPNHFSVAVKELHWAKIERDIVEIRLVKEHTEVLRDCYKYAELLNYQLQMPPGSKSDQLKVLKSKRTALYNEVEARNNLSSSQLTVNFFCVSLFFITCFQK